MSDRRQDIGVAVIVFASFAVGVLMQQLGCATTGAVIADVKECAAKTPKEAVDNLVPTVGLIIENGAPNWQEQLEALSSKLGMDVLVCAVGAVYKELSAPSSAEGKMKVVNPMPASRALQWLKAKRVAY